MQVQNKYANLRILAMIEDESLLKLLRMLLSDIGVAQIQSLGTSPNALLGLDSKQADVLFIDADSTAEQNKEIEIGYSLRQQGVNLPIVFLTSNLKQLAYKTMTQLQHVSFMSKELSSIKLLQTFELVFLQQENAILHQQLNKQKTAATRIQSAAQAAPSVSGNLETTQQLFFKVGDIYKAISVPEIAYFYADHKMSYAKTGDRSYPTSVQLKVLEEELHPWGFVRTHKSYIVNIKHIESFNLSEASVLINGETLPIGYAFKKTFMNSLKLLK